MLGIEKYSESFKESVVKRLERNECNFNNLVNKVNSIQVTQNEYKKRLKSLEDGRNHVENDNIELKCVKNILILFFIFLSLDLFEFILKY